MKTRWLLPLALTGLTGCAVYTPVGYRGGPAYREPVVIVQPAIVPLRPVYRGDGRRYMDRQGRSDRTEYQGDSDSDGAANGYDRWPYDARRR